MVIHREFTNQNGGINRKYPLVIFHILGISSSQLTNSIIFQRGRDQPPTSQFSIPNQSDMVRFRSISPDAKDRGVAELHWDLEIFSVVTSLLVDVTMHIPIICQPWCWYIKNYISLGDFGQGQMLVFIFQHHGSHLGLMGMLHFHPPIFPRCPMT